MEEKILVTGANGFIGKNLIAELKNRGYDTVFACDLDTTDEERKAYAAQCTFVFHLAGVNRPKVESEFVTGNTDFTRTILTDLKEAGNPVPVLLSSSTQAELDNPYGESKREAERLVFSYGEQTGAKVFVYRLPGVFGKWCRPNYNSVVATFCHNIARDLPITISDPAKEVDLVYIDDVIEAFLGALAGEGSRSGDFYRVDPVHTITLSDLAETIRSFRESRKTLGLPNGSDPLERKLYSTYLSYLPADDFAYPLQMKKDERGSFTEFLKTADRGQVSVNVAKPGITKGNHWHHTKNEKFLVVKGQARISFRRIGEEEVISYDVSDRELTVVDIPTGYLHNITNTGNEDLITIMWANEPFHPEHPDSYHETV